MDVPIGNLEGTKFKNNGQEANRELVSWGLSSLATTSRMRLTTNTFFIHFLSMHCLQLSLYTFTTA